MGELVSFSLIHGGDIFSLVGMLCYELLGCLVRLMKVEQAGGKRCHRDIGALWVNTWSYQLSRIPCN